MPKIPIIRPPEFRDRATDLGEGPESLSPEQTDALKAIEDRTARIDRGLAVSRAWRAGVERLSEAEGTPGGAPVGFTRSFLDDLDRERQQLVTELPPAGQAPLERDLLDLRADFLDRAAQVEASGMALRRRTALYDALDGYVAGVTRDPGQIDRAAGRMDSLIAGLGLPEERQGAMRLFVKDALGNAAVDGLMRDPARAERVLSDGLYDDVLSASSRTLRLKEAQDKVARNVHLDCERTIASLVTQAHDGAASEQAILQAQRGQQLSAADAAYLIETNARATEAARARDARIQRAATASERLDPSNPEDRAAGSEYWDSVSEVYASEDAKAQQESELRFVERTGVLPQALENKYRGALLSKDPMVVAPAAVAITRLGALNPALVQEIPPVEVARANAIAEYALLGVAPDRAVELGDEKLATESARPAGPTRPGEVQIAANDEPPVMSDATATEMAETDVGVRDSLHPEGQLARQGVQENAAILADLPDAVVATLAEEGLADDGEAAATLTQLTTAALALGLPLTDETAGILERYADGDAFVWENQLVPALLAFLKSVGPKAFREAVKRLGPLWRRLSRGKEKEGNKDDENKPLPPEPPLPRPTPGHPDDRKDEPDAGPQEEAGPQSPQALREKDQSSNGSDASERGPRTSQPREEETQGASRPRQAARNALEIIKRGWAELRKLAPENDEFFIRLPEGRFLKGSDGTADLGKAPRISNDDQPLEQLPIRIFRLDLKHIDTPAKEADANTLNYHSGVDLTLDVVQDWSTIRRGNYGRIILEKTNGKSRIAVVELKPSANGDYYRVVTSGVRNTENLEKFPVLQRR